VLAAVGGGVAGGQQDGEDDGDQRGGDGELHGGRFCRPDF
jgi:hypothetical protein